MKGKYITVHIRLAYLSVPAGDKRNIHEQLEETIKERKKIIQRLENMSQVARVIDMYLVNAKAA